MTLKDKLRNREYRTAYAESFLDSSIALQIKTLREERGWTQAELAERAGMMQSRISTLEQADYSSWSVKTLRRLAEAFDLVLSVRFESFGWLLNQATRFSRADLRRPSFNEDLGVQRYPGEGLTWFVSIASPIGPEIQEAVIEGSSYLTRSETGGDVYVC